MRPGNFSRTAGASPRNYLVSAWPRAWRAAWITLVLFLLLGSALLAQGSTVIGTVLYRDGKPAVNILVVIGQNYRYTDVSGRYKISGVPLGRQRMLCKRGSQILWQGDVEITASEMVVNRRLP